VAYPLKNGLAAIFGLSEEQLYGEQKFKEAVDPRWGVSSRTLHQKVGTEVFRDLLKTVIPDLTIPEGLTLWSYLLKMRLASMPDQDVVIGDVRFPDEAKVIREAGGIIIGVTRNTGATDTHSSENQCIECDFTIENNGNLLDLERSVVRIIESLRNPIRRKTTLVLDKEPQSMGDLEQGVLQ
jgi:hypothetical protein